MPRKRQLYGRVLGGDTGRIYTNFHIVGAALQKAAAKVERLLRRGRQNRRRRMNFNNAAVKRRERRKGSPGAFSAHTGTGL